MTKERRTQTQSENTHSHTHREHHTVTHREHHTVTHSQRTPQVTQSENTSQPHTVREHPQYTVREYLTATHREHHTVTQPENTSQSHTAREHPQSHSQRTPHRHRVREHHTVTQSENSTQSHRVRVKVSLLTNILRVKEVTAVVRHSRTPVANQQRRGPGRSMGQQVKSPQQSNWSSPLHSQFCEAALTASSASRGQ